MSFTGAGADAGAGESVRGGEDERRGGEDDRDGGLLMCEGSNTMLSADTEGEVATGADEV